MPKIPSAFFAKPASYVLHIYLSIVGWRPSKHRQKLTNLNCVYSVFHTTSPSLHLPNWGYQQHQDNTAKYLQNMFRFRIVNGFPASINAVVGRVWKRKMTLESQTTSDHNRLCKFRTQLNCIEKLQMKLSLHDIQYDIHERMLDINMYIYIYVNLDHLSMCEHVASILHLFAKPQKWDPILEVQSAHMRTAFIDAQPLKTSSKNTSRNYAICKVCWLETP